METSLCQYVTQNNLTLFQVAKIQLRKDISQISDKTLISLLDKCRAGSLVFMDDCNCAAYHIHGEYGNDFNKQWCDTSDAFCWLHAKGMYDEANNRLDASRNRILLSMVKAEIRKRSRSLTQTPNPMMVEVEVLV